MALCLLHHPGSWFKSEIYWKSLDRTSHQVLFQILEAKISTDPNLSTPSFVRLTTVGNVWPRAAKRQSPCRVRLHVSKRVLIYLMNLRKQSEDKTLGEWWPNKRWCRKGRGSNFWTGVVGTQICSNWAEGLCRESFRPLAKLWTSGFLRKCKEESLPSGKK